ncbi:type II toxin-antitoxin system PemK/MazF family toxin [Paenibacillus graminis]|uniref:type II toxin-antitoxin system PemK/MazF family toxin n=1 Tax=Paenibacillus graminis TaxID=189425 RepID=UPI002DBBA07B|nr:type II toxin-antitoxin system PemK/MazF family toxin [Paenibacillus graminis]MEC0167361.1 type II toxin-antitoxin system PemK/MazF family toxin [Paenibacillus graminis]
MNHNRGDVYLVLYPFDDGEEEKLRPGIVLDTQGNRSIVIKVTSHDVRAADPKDLIIQHWKQAGLSQPSVARCSQYVPLHHEKIGRFLGTLHDEDMLNVLSKFYE